ncbi:putative transcriptional regulatory protein YJL206C [Aspergillus awamori]|uniref:Putative transcriptional regulatory protein YJL206C n=1 Tax=Aspergillus awamori TaxID=105351 RepID=A0A401KVL4_ASPAW|nr:putative transcriptional regulatory protein YJL206C [Aspergillus awamori]
MMSFRPGATDCGPTGQATGREGGLDFQRNGSDEHEVMVKERVAVCEHFPTRVAYGFEANMHSVIVAVSGSERRLEHISNRIEELYGIIGQLRDERRNGDSTLMAPAGSFAPSYTSPQTGSPQVLTNAPAPAKGIETALFIHVICAARALETAVMNDPYSRAIDDITSALNNLRSTVNVQKQQNETLEGPLSFLKTLPSGLSLRDLPIPPLDKIMACLRITQESSPRKIYWPFEFGSLGDFTRYVIRACTPGPISDTELIIVHYVLYSLFTQCSISVDDETLRQDYDAQASTCRESLETILSSLSFHLDTNIDSICALYMASLHCLHRGNVSTAWTFISRASLMCLALGMHSSYSMVTEQENAMQRKMYLFWAVYALEKAVALRLGMPSTIRDQDITIPRLTLDRKMTSLAYSRLPDWIDFASLCGRLYDSLYSPTALTRPVSVRVSRTSALASELEPLDETEASIAILSDAAKWPSGLHEWVNEILFLAPFVPLTILVCNVIDNADSADLGRLKRVLDGLQSLAQSPRYASCNRQLHTFKPLFDVAARYVEAKTSRESTDAISSLFTNPHTDVYFDGDTWLENGYPSVSSLPLSNML